MTREERNNVLNETKEVFNEFTGLAIERMTEFTSDDDDENLLMIKMLRLSKRMMDYAEFQAKQFDHIEDKLDGLYNLVEKGMNKEVL